MTGGEAMGNKRPLEDHTDLLQHAAPARKPMKLAEKLRIRNRGGGGGDIGNATGGGASRNESVAMVSGALGVAAASAVGFPGGRAGDGGLLTWKDVATPRDPLDGATVEPSPAMFTSALQRVGSVKFSALTGIGKSSDDLTAVGGTTTMTTTVAATPRGRSFATLPMDWSLKTHAKFTSSKPMAWVARAAGAKPAGAGLRAFAGAAMGVGPGAEGEPPKYVGRDTTMPTTTEEGGSQRAAGDTMAMVVAHDSTTLAAANDDHRRRARSRLASSSSVAALTAEERLQRALYTFTYPADPASSELVHHMRRGDAGRRWLERRMDGWADALVSVYGALRVGQCAAFYLVYDERVVLFCAPGVAAGDDGRGQDADADAAASTHAAGASSERGHSRRRQMGFALVTNASAGGRFRTALDDADVPYEAIGEEKAGQKTGRHGFTGGNAGAAGAGGGGDGRSRGGAYGHGIPLEEWAQEDPTALEGWEDNNPVLDNHGGGAPRASLPRCHARVPPRDTPAELRSRT